ncbi:hypothetical protein CCACVL1_04859, partial [Corchorus capsularis]
MGRRQCGGAMLRGSGGCNNDFWPENEKLGRWVIRMGNAMTVTLNPLSHRKSQ